jgi:uncharacterized protein (DUF58 family)
MPAPSYLPPETLARLSGLEFRARALVDGFLSGLHRSPQRGFSVEFAEHREYVPGDDLRYVDWKVYGKRDRFYLKQFEAETNFVCHVLLDVSDSMRYRSPGAAVSKLEYAKFVASALAYLVLRQQDAVGLCTFAGGAQQSLAPSGQPASLKPIVHLLESIPGEMQRNAARGETTQGGAARGDAPPGLEHALHEQAERIHRRALIVILSDCFRELPVLLPALRHFRHRRHDVSVMQVVDPAEQDFPFDEPTLFHDLEVAQSEFVDPRTVRAAYQAEFERFRHALEAGCRDSGADYVLLRTDQPVESALSAYLLRRSRRGPRQ